MNLDGIMSITKNLFYTGTVLFPSNLFPNILEIGSGIGTKCWVGAGYNVHTIEHDPQWIGSVEGAEYCFAPLHDQYYDRAMIKTLIQMPHDIWIIDGPPGNISDRTLLLEILEEGNYQIPKVFIVDDTHRNDGQVIAKYLINKFNNQVARFDVPNLDPGGPPHLGTIIIPLTF